MDNNIEISYTTTWLFDINKLEKEWKDYEKEGGYHSRPMPTTKEEWKDYLLSLDNFNYLDYICVNTWCELVED